MRGGGATLPWWVEGGGLRPRRIYVYICTAERAFEEPPRGMLERCLGRRGDDNCRVPRGQKAEYQDAPRRCSWQAEAPKPGFGHVRHIPATL